MCVSRGGAEGERESFKCLFIFERERQRASEGGAERERETQNPKQVPGSAMSEQSPTWNSNS